MKLNRRQLRKMIIKEARKAILNEGLTDFIADMTPFDELYNFMNQANIFSVSKAFIAGDLPGNILINANKGRVDIAMKELRKALSKHRVF